MLVVLWLVSTLEGVIPNIFNVSSSFINLKVFGLLVEADCQPKVRANKV